MLELIVFKFFTKNIIYYNKYYNIIKDIALEKELKILLNCIHKYYQLFPAHTYIGQEEFTTFFMSEYSQLKDKGDFLQLITNMYQMDVSGSLATDVIKKLLEVHTANHIVNELFPIISGQEFGLVNKVEPIIQKFLQTTADQDSDNPFVDCGLAELLEAKASDGLTWRLQGLQDAIGCLCGGTLGHLFARPETGKTTMLHSEAANFASQLTDEHPLLWINNEEDSKSVRLRFYSAVCGASLAQIKQHVDQAEALFTKNGGYRVRLYDSASISVEEVEALCRKWQPRLVLIDQGDKLMFKGCDKADNGAGRLKQLYDKLREVTKRCNEDWKMDMLTVGQADAPAEGKKWLFQTNLDGGKTGKSGAFDYIIGVGKTFNEAEEQTRFISLCKNKLTGKHAKFVATIDTDKARYQ